jgi:hypothetical protein
VAVAHAVFQQEAAGVAAGGKRPGAEFDHARRTLNGGGRLAAAARVRCARLPRPLDAHRPGVAVVPRPAHREVAAEVQEQRLRRARAQQRQHAPRKAPPASRRRESGPLTEGALKCAWPLVTFGGAR